MCAEAAQQEWDKLHTIAGTGEFKYVKKSDVPAGTKIYHGTWDFREKYDENDNFQKLKARWCFVGSEQEPGVDFHDTYAPSSRPSSFRMCLAAAAKEGLKGEQADLKSAFCHTILPDTDIHQYICTRLKA